MQHKDEINLNTLNKKVLTLIAGQPDCVKIYLRGRSHALVALDKAIADLLANYAKVLTNFHEKDQTEQRAAIVREYGVIKTTLAELGRAMSEFTLPHPVENKEQNQQVLDAIHRIGSEATLLAEHMPAFELHSFTRLIYDFCKALGGISIQISQSNLPNIGIEVEAGKKPELSGGKCAGLQNEWAEQSINQGTPRYPLTSTISVLQKQDRQGILLQERYIVTPDCISLQHEFNIQKIFGQLKENIPYQIRLSENEGGHAVGVRKHANCVEIYDPNFGNLFLPSASAAADLFTLLLSNYRSADMSYTKIGILEYGAYDQDYVIPRNEFVTNGLINESIQYAASEDGYQLLLTNTRRHIEWMVTYLEPHEMFSTVAGDLVTLGKHLRKDDLIDLVILLQAVRDGMPCAEATVKKFFNTKKSYDKLLSTCANEIDKNIVNSAIQFLQQLPGRELIPVDVAACIAQYQNEYKLCLQQSYVYASELRAEQGKQSSGKMDQVVVRDYELKLEILEARMTQLRRANIPNKLVDGCLGKTSYNMADAEHDIKKYLGTEFNAVSLEPHLTTLKNMDALRPRLTSEECKVHDELRAKILRTPDVSTTVQAFYNEFADHFDDDKKLLDVADVKLKKAFIAELTRERDRIQHSWFGGNQIRDAKAAALTMLYAQVLKDKRHGLVEILQIFSKQQSEYECKSNYDLLATQRRTGIFWLFGIFNPSKTGSQKLMDKYLNPSKNLPSPGGL